LAQSGPAGGLTCRQDNLLSLFIERRDGSFAKQMSTEPDIRSWPASQRSEHYQELATKLRRIAEAEKVPELRAQILALARQYQELVTGLRTKRRFVGGAQKENVE
jgi:hypothetical protein